MACNHPAPQWRLTGCNEDGWHCAECDKALGFRPDLDREHTHEKVGVVLLWLHEHEFMYISNSSEGDSITSEVAHLCAAADEYDQQTIIYLIAACGREDHAKFWQDEAKQAQCEHPSRTLEGSSAVCNACGHAMAQVATGPLFDNEEPF